MPDTAPIDDLAAAPLTDLIKRGTRLFSDDGAQPRARRATDVILFALSTIGLILVGLVAEPEPGYSRAVTEVFVSLPDALAGMWQFIADVPVVWAVAIFVIALVRRRLPIARDILLAAATAAALWYLLGRIVEGAFPSILDGFNDAAPPPFFPAGRLAVPGAALIAASPHLVRPARRFGRWSLLTAAFATVALSASSSLGVIAGLLIAAGAAAIVHLVVGSSAGRPSLDDVRYALADLGVGHTELGVAARQDAGQFAVTATDLDGRELIIKVYGRDAHDAALLSTVRRTIWLRRPGSPVGFGRLRQVEHEAFITLLAGQEGIRTDTVVIAGATESDDAVLVLRRSGELLVEPNRVIDANAAPDQRFAGPDGAERIEELWDLIAHLHRSGIAHNQLDEDHLIVQDGHLGLVDFRGATVAPSAAALRTDEVQMLITTAVLAGRDAAVAGLVAKRPNEEIESNLAYLQSTALTPDQRRMIRSLDLDLDDLRNNIAEKIGVDAPKLVQLRRFSIGSVVRIALPLLAAFMLVSALAGFDLGAFLDSLQDAKWWLVVIGLVVAQMPRIAQAVATLGAAPVPLPLGPVYALQLAISYVNLAIPTAAARIAVNVRFFQRQGVAPGAAIATGALDGVSGFIVQAILLLSLLAFSPLSLDLEFDNPTPDAARLAVIIGSVLLVAVIVIAAIPKLRRFIVGWIRHFAQEAMSVLSGLRSPRRLLMLFGGNFAAEILFATALGVFVQAFGYSVPLDRLLFINMSVALLSGLIPVPGGIGVTEGGLIFGLTSAGVPQEAAFAAVILCRLATFYLPPIWGFFSLNWLERNSYL
jgi:glycosyltransferase 2 family protein